MSYKERVIGEKQKGIPGSIYYARRLQSSLMPNENKLNALKEPSNEPSDSTCQEK